MNPPVLSGLTYVELAAASNFSFLRGASHAEELVVQASRLGLGGIAITDRNSLAGVVRAHMAAKEAGLAFAPGCRLVFMDATPDILVWPEDRAAYAHLCELLTTGKRRASKGECHLMLEDLLTHGGGLLMAVVTPAGAAGSGLNAALDRLREAFPDHLHLALSRAHGSADQRHMAMLVRLARKHRLPLVAIGDVLYHAPGRRPLQDVLTCIREGKTLATVGTRLQANAERHLRSHIDMMHLFKGFEAAVAQAATLFRRIRFSLDELRYQYPDAPMFEELGPDPLPSQEALEKLTAIGLKKRYPEGTPEKVLKAIAHETKLIKKLDYAPYFLTVYDIVRFARSQKILCQGRGSAANSAVCYCLEITEVDPGKVDLLFERFISEERNEPPDIDVDFEHERREEVIQYIYAKYGRERAGLAATVITYRARSAIREVGKVFGLSDDAISAISGTKWGGWSREVDAEDARRAGLDPTDKHLAQMLDLASQIVGFPRHLSQHVGGFVITRDKLSSLIPIENAAMEDRTIVEWDKDDLESLGMLKIDVLALGMLTCIRKAFGLLDSHYGRHETLASLPDNDTPTYDMICRADTIGVFQIESRAQMSMLPRLKPRCYYDLVIEVAIVRPGPIQGDMVHPYLRRRQGKEQVSFPKEELRAVLGKTLGVPLFQEQAMNIAIVAGGFSPGEADKLRRAMATFRRVGTIGSFQTKMVEGMVGNGYERAFAEHCFRQIEGFGEYGFPESHAASFALLVYVSCWLKCHYPDVFCAAILNSQPMGFYASAQLIRDAREHGVEIRPVDINCSDQDCTLERDADLQPLSARHREMKNIMKHSHAVRLGLRHVKGFGEAEAEQLMARRGRGYDSVRDLWMRSGLPRRSIEQLAEADCFRSIGLDRRDALWAVKALDPLSSAERLPLFALVDTQDLQKEPDVDLPPMPLGEQVINDYQSLSFSLKAHPMSFLRERLAGKGCRANSDLQDIRSGRVVKVSGLVLVRQRPGSAKGVVFETIEDETGVANIIVWPKVFEKFRAIVLGSRCVGVRGKLQNEEGVIHVVAEYLEDLTPMMAQISDMASEMGGLANADEVRRPIEDMRARTKPAAQIIKLIRDAPELRQDYEELATARAASRALPKGRNFH
ncbi:DNA-directed DNA polymerase III PolC [Hoeflea sp. IMCC20628]|uniref:error-prone DNA polymerase n=1 Tax=Hoeflea sp. IMCC20628 TaxID=1620421 RepID=UPI00063AD09D|nr:error-prone DNA polymerase [Hoeflea sp. IMCC20628]AKI02404.1 DNA-directed DNA polymerase III PolC [Hoeflea sp. IMCC20628]